MGRGTMLDYLAEYGDRTFLDEPINDVDSLILCQFVYLKFDGMVPDVHSNKPSVTIGELAAHPDYERLYADTRFEKDNRALFEAMQKSRRFGKLRMNGYINIIEKEWETQFCAMTFFLEDGTMYVAFRGTDETIIGWKEDFNMAYLSPVPGQAYSVKYLNMVTGRLHNPFYVGGHSKGGNLAVYSAMNCAPHVRERILKIYNMDGPGLRPEVLEECNYDAIADKVVKILPHSSLVGMLFEEGSRYQVVESKTSGFAQHNPYTWLVQDGDFIHADTVAAGQRRVDSTVNEWILSLDEEKRRSFIDTLYQILSASQAEDLIALTADWRGSMNGMIAAMKELDEETRNMLKEIVKALFELAASHFKQEISSAIPHRGKRRKSVEARTETRKEF